MKKEGRRQATASPSGLRPRGKPCVTRGYPLPRIEKSTEDRKGEESARLTPWVRDRKKTREKSHVRYPTRYPTLRNAEETAEYQYARGIPLAPQAGFPVTSGNPFFIPKSKIQNPNPHPNSSTRWRKPDAAKHLTVQKPPPGGRILPPTSLPASQNLQSLEKTRRNQTSHSPDSPSHWNK